MHLPSRKYLQICLPLCSTVCWLMNSWLILTHFFTGLPSWGGKKKLIPIVSAPSWSTGDADTGNRDTGIAVPHGSHRILYCHLCPCRDLCASASSASHALFQRCSCSLVGKCLENRENLFKGSQKLRGNGSLVASKRGRWNKLNPSLFAVGNVISDQPEHSRKSIPGSFPHPGLHPKMPPKLPLPFWIPFMPCFFTGSFGNGGPKSPLEVSLACLYCLSWSAKSSSFSSSL